MVLSLGDLLNGVASLAPDLRQSAASVLLPQPHGVEGLLLGTKVLPADDSALSEGEDPADRNVHLDPAAAASHADRPPGEHLLAQTAHFDVQLEGLPRVPRVRD